MEDISETDDPTLVGENCHIVAEKDDGPRGQSDMHLADRNRYGNLVLLCSIHHKIIDDNDTIWTVPALHKLKQEHESWVEQSLGLDMTKIKADGIYADYIDEWSRLIHLDEWTGWSSFILGGGQPRIRTEIDNDLATLRHWLLGRIWPGKYLSVENAFKNLQMVLQDFHETLRSHLDYRYSSEMLFTEKFYKIDNWDPERYRKLADEYEFHVDLVCDLMLELTRAANLVCDEVRHHIAHNYRLREGNLIVQRGPDMKLQFVDFVVRYSNDELTASSMPYAGLTRFYKDRASRDWSIGQGHPPP